MEKKLAIAGKRIKFNNLENKSLAQYMQQLKQNGVMVEEDTAERLYKNLRGEMTESQTAAKAEAMAKAAEMKAAAEENAKKSVKPIMKGK